MISGPSKLINCNVVLLITVTLEMEKNPEKIVCDQLAFVLNMFSYLSPQSKLQCQYGSYCYREL